MKVRSKTQVVLNEQEIMHAIEQYVINNSDVQGMDTVFNQTPEITITQTVTDEEEGDTAWVAYVDYPHAKHKNKGKDKDEA